MKNDRNDPVFAGHNGSHRARVCTAEAGPLSDWRIEYASASRTACFCYGEILPCMNSGYLRVYIHLRSLGATAGVSLYSLAACALPSVPCLRESHGDERPQGVRH